MQQKIFDVIKKSRSENGGCTLKDTAKAISEALLSSETSLLVAHLTDWLTAKNTIEASGENVPLPF